MVVVEAYFHYGVPNSKRKPVKISFAPDPVSGNLCISLKLQIRAVVWKRGAHQPGGPPLRTTTAHPFRSSPPGMSGVSLNTSDCFFIALFKVFLPSTDSATAVTVHGPRHTCPVRLRRRGRFTLSCPLVMLFLDPLFPDPPFLRVVFFLHYSINVIAFVIVNCRRR